MDFTGKVAFITGGGNDIGRATAMAFSQRGAKVVIVDRDAKAAESTAGSIKQQGGDALAVTADVTRSAEVQAYGKATLDKYGRIDCFFNNAGIEGRIAHTQDYDEAMFDQVIGVRWCLVRVHARQCHDADHADYDHDTAEDAVDVARSRPRVTPAR